jgi:hypothetical protein
MAFSLKARKVDVTKVAATRPAMEYMPSASLSIAITTKLIVSFDSITCLPQNRRYECANVLLRSDKLKWIVFCPAGPCICSWCRRFWDLNGLGGR